MEIQSPFMLRLSLKNTAAVTSLLFTLWQLETIEEKDIEDLASLLFPTEESEISIYCTSSEDRFCLAHALGLMASIYGRTEFKLENVRQKVEAWLSKNNSVQNGNDFQAMLEGPCIDGSGPVYSFIFSTAELERIGEIIKSPNGNRHLSIANDNHYDIIRLDRPRLLRFLRELAAERRLVYYRNTKSHYIIQATIILVHCSSAVESSHAHGPGQVATRLRDRDELILRMLTKDCTARFRLLNSHTELLSSE